MTEDALYVGLDLGTSSLKGVVLDAEGRAVAEVRRAYETARPGAGRAEQDPLDWTAAARSALAALAAATPAADWAGIGLSGMIPTLVTVDADLRPVGPAFTWEDCRAHAEAEEIAAQAGEIDLYERTGQPMDGRYLLPMYAWIDRQRPRARGAHRARARRQGLPLLLAHRAARDRPEHRQRLRGLRPGPAAPGWRDVAALAGAAGERRRARQAGPPARRPVDRDLAAGAAPGARPGPARGTARVRRRRRLRARGAGARRRGPRRRGLRVGHEHRHPRRRRRAARSTPSGAASSRRWPSSGWGTEMDLVSTGAAVALARRACWASATAGQARVFAAAAEAADGLVPAALPFVGVGEQGALWDNDVRGTVRRPRPLPRAGRPGARHARRHHPREPSLPRAPARARPAAGRRARRLARRRPLVLPAAGRRQRPHGDRRRPGDELVGGGRRAASRRSPRAKALPAAGGGRSALRRPTAPRAAPGTGAGASTSGCVTPLRKRLPHVARRRREA